MNAGAVIPLIAAPGCAIYLVLVRRAITTMRAGDEDWRQRWRELDPARRKAVRDCMKRGDPVSDRGDAELSLRAVAQVQHVRKAIAPPTFVSLLMVVAFLVAGVVSGSIFLTLVHSDSGRVPSLASCLAGNGIDMRSRVRRRGSSFTGWIAARRGDLHGSGSQNQRGRVHSATAQRTPRTSDQGVLIRGLGVSIRNVLRTPWGDAHLAGCRAGPARAGGTCFRGLRLCRVRARSDRREGVRRCPRWPDPATTAFPLVDQRSARSEVPGSSRN
jgi:hypothetical protein